jgi:glutamine cyclotransferase
MNNEEKIEVSKLKSVYAKLKKFDYLTKDSNYITVTEWANGEGWDITIDDKNFQLSYGTLDAINYLTHYLQYEVN